MYIVNVSVLSNISIPLLLFLSLVRRRAEKLGKEGVHLSKSGKCYIAYRLGAVAEDF